MAAIFRLSCGKEHFLVSPYEILALLPKKQGFDEETLERILCSLELDGYFELILSDRKGEKTYVIAMREAGKSFLRQDVRRRRDLAFRLVLAVATGLLSAACGLLIKLLV